MNKTTHLENSEPIASKVDGSVPAQCALENYSSVAARPKHAEVVPLVDRCSVYGQVCCAMDDARTALY